MFCSRCGTTIRPGKGFCMNCGAPVSGPVSGGVQPVPFDAPAYPAAPPGSSSAIPSGQPKKKAAWKVAVVAVIIPLVVLGAVLGGMALFSSGKGGDEAGAVGADGDEGVDVVTGRIETASPVEVARRVVPASGGTLTVEKAGSPLKGLSLEVPGGSYPEGREFTISESTVTSNTFGEGFDPVLPVIDVDNGGGYSEQFMLLKLPLAENGDAFYSAFFYDEETGELESIPVASSDSGGLTLATRYFAREGSRRPKRILVLDHSRSSLEQSARGGIWVRFKPENDGWAFTNLDAYSEPGLCAGMCLSATWYFSEKKKAKGASPLYKSYDNGTPGFDPDDATGIKFSTVLQHDMNWEELEENMNASMNSSDTRNYLAIADIFDGTGKPVLISLFGTGAVGHVVVAYKIRGGKISIYDPNYPGEECYILYEDGKFQEYGGFSEIKCIGTFSSMPNKLEERWKELEAGTIGDDIFPDYDLSFDYTEFRGGMGLGLRGDGGEETTTDFVRIYVKDADTDKPDPLDLTVTVYKGTEEMESKPNGTYALDVGDNELGLLIRERYSDYWVGWDSVIIEREGDEEEQDGKRTATELRRTYYDTGELFREWYSYFDEDGEEVYDGPWKTYLKSGVVSQDANYEDGLLEGTSTIYFDNGNPDRTWTYKDGKMNGTMTRYRRDGTVEYTCEYVDDNYVQGSDKYY